MQALGQPPAPPPCVTQSFKGAGPSGQWLATASHMAKADIRRHRSKGSHFYTCNARARRPGSGTEGKGAINWERWASGVGWWADWTGTWGAAGTKWVFDRIWKRSAKGYMAARPMLPSWQLADSPQFSGQQSKTMTNKYWINWDPIFGAEIRTKNNTETRS